VIVPLLAQLIDACVELWLSQATLVKTRQSSQPVLNALDVDITFGLAFH